MYYISEAVINLPQRVVAIDFGTTFCAYAHSCNPTEMFMNKNWADSLGEEVVSLKQYLYLIHLVICRIIF